MQYLGAAIHSFHFSLLLQTHIKLGLFFRPVGKTAEFFFQTAGWLLQVNPARQKHNIALIFIQLKNRIMFMMLPYLRMQVAYCLYLIRYIWIAKSEGLLHFRRPKWTNIKHLTEHPHSAFVRKWTVRAAQYCLKNWIGYEMLKHFT